MGRGGAICDRFVLVEGFVIDWLEKEIVIGSLEEEIVIDGER